MRITVTGGRKIVEMKGVSRRLEETLHTINTFIATNIHKCILMYIEMM